MNKYFFRFFDRLVCFGLRPFIKKSFVFFSSLSWFGLHKPFIKGMGAWIFLLALPISCGEGAKKANVSAGESTSYQVGSISCSQGNFTVTVKSTPGSTTPIDPKKLNYGDEVEISGSTGGSTFSCKGTVHIPPNHSFKCVPSTISSVGTALAGDFHFWSNGSRGSALGVKTSQELLSFTCL